MRIAPDANSDGSRGTCRPNSGNNASLRNRAHPWGVGNDACDQRWPRGLSGPLEPLKSPFSDSATDLAAIEHAQTDASNPAQHATIANGGLSCLLSSSSTAGTLHK
jgi:hypothetical protein